jgi:hypothetical protein
MKKVNRKFATILVITTIIVITVIVVVYMFSLKQKHMDQNTKKNNIENSKEENDPELKETSAGFYLYDVDRKPIYNNQSITATKEMEFNIQCKNICKVELNYTLVILVNDCYQNVSYTGDNNVIMENGKGTLAAGETNDVNVKFSVRCQKRKSNEIRVIMLYYPNDIPQDDLDQILVADTVESHPLVLGSDFDKTTSNYIDNMAYYAVNNNDIQNGIWITDIGCKQIPKFDFWLKAKENQYVYFNSVGNTNTYYGIIFVDGVPKQIGNDFVFEWKQKKGFLSAIKVEAVGDEKENVFAYMYEKGSLFDDTYVTGLYIWKK